MRDDGSIRVEATETLGQYADWLQIPTQKLRNVNKLKARQPVLLGQKLNLDYSRVSREAFEQVRRDYHAKLQGEFFVQHRIAGTEVYIVRRGDSLWTMTQKFSNLPIWLLRQYNPDTDLSDLRAGTQVVMPRVEVVAGSYMEHASSGTVLDPLRNASRDAQVCSPAHPCPHLAVGEILQARVRGELHGEQALIGPFLPGSSTRTDDVRGFAEPRDGGVVDLEVIRGAPRRRNLVWRLVQAGEIRGRARSAERQQRCHSLRRPGTASGDGSMGTASHTNRFAPAHQVGFERADEGEASRRILHESFAIQLHGPAEPRHGGSGFRVELFDDGRVIGQRRARAEQGGDSGHDHETRQRIAVVWSRRLVIIDSDGHSCCIEHPKL